MALNKMDRMESPNPNISMYPLYHQYGFNVADYPPILHHFILLKHLSKLGKVLWPTILYIQLIVQVIIAVYFFTVNYRGIL